MPFLLDSLEGGLGNQLFIIMTLYAIARKYNTTFSIINTQTTIESPVGDFTIPNYSYTIFSAIINCKYCQRIESNYPLITINIAQFQEFSLPEYINPNTTIIRITGLPMKYSLFSEYLHELTDLMYLQKIKYIPVIIKDSSVRKVGIMFRTFVQEKKNQWMVVNKYYKIAIEYMLKQYTTYSIEFHIFTDEVGVLDYIIKPIIDTLGLKIPCTEYVGMRDNKTDVEHFFKMFDLDDYILCNSTFHYWPALLSQYTNDTVVTFPSYTKDGNNMDWFKHIVPDHWVKL